MWLLVGLGNPGAGYARNRHNVGFRVLDHLAERGKAPVVWKEKLGAALAEVALPGAGQDKVLLCKPQEFMNVSGQAVSRVASFWKVPPQQIAVVYDELDLPFGRLRVAQGGGHGGHNGVRSLLAELPAPSFARVRFGIGRPPDGRDAASWVLANFAKDEEPALTDLIVKAADALVAIVTQGPTVAMNRFNAKEPARSKEPQGAEGRKSAAGSKDDEPLN